MEKEKIRIISLGGLGEVGLNMILLEHKEKILIMDMGLGFPDENMHGIDFIIPNINYLKGKEKNILGVIFTHGHYDHIGAVPYIMPKIGSIPMYAGALTKGIILKRQEDFSNEPKLNIEKITEKSKIKLGPFQIEFFRQNHNIPDNFGLIINTPVGNIVHTSDFKFDASPVNESPTNFERLKEIGNKGILLLMSESTGAEEEGHSLSEKTIFANLDKIFQKTRGRIISASFASLINRIQQLITLSERYNRKVVIEGYSLKTNIEICETLGKIKIKKGTIINAKDIGKYPDSKISIICTGAQGEENASFMRIANKEHKFIHIKNRDTIIFSSSIVPGNERSVQALKDEFYRQGARVFHYKMMDIHASGHAKQDELKQMIKIMKPKFFVPIYGQYSMLVRHADLAEEQGIKKQNIVVAENGEIINISQNKIFKEKKKVSAGYLMVDKSGVGDIGEIVLKDRQNLAQDGMFVIIAIIDKKTGKVKGSPDIISRGFIYLRESKQLLKETRQKTIKTINKLTESGHVVNWTFVKKELKNKISQFLYSKTKRKPIVLPVIIEV
ncbi:ribonuclease J [Candidatus Atribacteria bacterium MT.SAG.1]|nr:ribonuclease J [Candidatus Atribacteria bacterium MT.SAG.1]